MGGHRVSGSRSRTVIRHKSQLVARCDDIIPYLRVGVSLPLATPSVFLHGLGSGFTAESGLDVMIPLTDSVSWQPNRLRHPRSASFIARYD